MSFRFSIIVPALNEGSGIKEALTPLATWRKQGHELILVDGGSSDETVACASPEVDRVIISERGRARQMNAGAAVASGDVLLFLHADTHLPGDTLSLISSMISPQRPWGRFDVRLSGKRKMFRVIENMMNWRSRLTGIATGDQAMFVLRSQFEMLGGFAEQPLMEDIELSKRLRRLAWPICIDTPLVTSSRRWEQRGVFTTILLMWRLRLLYWLGVDAKKLAELYR